ncbi:MAG: ABC transporter ATP-binding protein [Patescibacteria group bacterium]
MAEYDSNKNKYISGIGVFVRYLNKFTKILLFVCLINVVTAFLNVAVPYLSGSLLDSIIMATGGVVKESIVIRILQGSFFYIFSIWLLFGFFDAILARFSSRMTRGLDISLENTYYIDFIAKLVHLPIGFHANRKIGELIQNISKGASWLSNLADELFQSVLPSLLSMIAGVIIAFTLSPILGLTLLIGGVVFILSILPLVKNSEGLQDRTWRLFSDAYEVAYETIDHVKEVKQAGQENVEINKVSNLFNNIAAPVWIRLVQFWQNLNFFQRLVVISIQAVLFILGFKLVLAGTISVGELAALNGYAALILGPFVTIGRSWQRIQSAITYLARNEEIYQLAEEKYRPEKEYKPDFSKGISFENVYFNYEKEGKEVLKGLSFNISSGMTVALVGRSGEGKSTIIDLIGGFYFSSKGDVLIGGVSIRNLALQELRKKIAYVPQEIYLFNTTLRENLIYGSEDVFEAEIMKVVIESGLEDFVRSLSKGLETVVGERGIKLSVGQKQRIAIARAMLRNPQILILDEPTSALDIETERFISLSLEKLMKGRTTLIIAHRLSTVRKADTILVLEDGKVAESGKHNELIKKKDGVYKKFHEMYLGSYENKES